MPTILKLRDYFLQKMIIVWLKDHDSDILALRQNFVVGHKKWIFVYRIPC